MSDIIQHMYNQEGGWNLRKPQLILSVTGAHLKFAMSSRIKKAFKLGLVKAAESTDAWIITGGTNTGVMRLVGEAAAHEFTTTKLTVIGVVAWGKTAFREKLIVRFPRRNNTVAKPVFKARMQYLFYK